MTHHQCHALISHYLLIVKMLQEWGSVALGKVMLWLRQPLFLEFLDPVGAAAYPVWVSCPGWPCGGDSLEGRSCHILADDEHGPPHCHFLKGLAQTRAALESLGFASK